MSHRSLLPITAVVTALVLVSLLPNTAFAQVSPWERSASALASSITGPVARGFSLVAVVFAGVGLMFSEGGAFRTLMGVILGLGLALNAAQFVAWLA